MLKYSKHASSVANISMKSAMFAGYCLMPQTTTFRGTGVNCIALFGFAN